MLSVLLRFTDSDFPFSIFKLFIYQLCGHIVTLFKTKRVRRVWRYQRVNQNLYIEEEQTTQWPKEKVQKGKQRSTKHTHKTKDRVTRTPLKTGGELKCSGRVNSSCSSSGTRRVNLITNPVIGREWEKKRNIFEATTSTLPKRFLEKGQNKLENCCNVLFDVLNVISDVRWGVLIRKPWVIWD